MTECERTRGERKKESSVAIDLEDFYGIPANLILKDIHLSG